jgi:hypothetical protein
LSKYCKAYPLDQLRAFPAWNERQISRPLKGDDVVYLHDDYTVTDGIFPDENILFADVTEAWKTFCTSTLQFAVPQDLSSGIDRSSET